MDELKVTALRELVSTVVENTRRETQGQSASRTKEKRAAAKVLGLMLGRRVKVEEVELALAV